jgi:hypothetical protein
MTETDNNSLLTAISLQDIHQFKYISLVYSVCKTKYMSVLWVVKSCVRTNHSYPLTNPHGVTTNEIIDTFTTVRTSNLTNLFDYFRIIHLFCLRLRHDRLIKDDDSGEDGRKGWLLPLTYSSFFLFERLWKHETLRQVCGSPARI